MKLKNILYAVVISVATSVFSVFIYGKLISKNINDGQLSEKLPVQYAHFFDGNKKAGPADFTAAAASSISAVVHIKTHISQRQVSSKEDRNDPFSNFFGSQPQIIPEQLGSGSGVILSDDGYIVTNNHVIEDADNISVTLNGHKTYKAVLIGADPKTDIAVLKIAATNLPYLAYGNSDAVETGQWVLAIGYPWNLDITVTAGIISAKTRSVGINKPDHPVETFIQTDAAVNLGNSGGALINTAGELIGINTALASPTGAYAGYSYALPVNVVKKVVNDLIKYGAVKGS